MPALSFTAARCIALNSGRRDLVRLRGRRRRCCGGCEHTGSFWTTPVLAGGHLYCVNQDGLTSVVRLADDKGEVVAENKLGEPVFGSPAVAGDAIYLRSDPHLWKMIDKRGKP